MITIERGIPMPSTHGRYGEIREAMRTMEVGDSFVIPSQFNHQRIQSSTCNKKVKNGIMSSGKKFSFRKYAGKSRCWRIR